MIVQVCIFFLTPTRVFLKSRWFDQQSRVHYMFYFYFFFEFQFFTTEFFLDTNTTLGRQVNRFLPQFHISLHPADGQVLSTGSSAQVGTSLFVSWNWLAFPSVLSLCTDSAHSSRMQHACSSSLFSSFFPVGSGAFESLRSLSICLLLLLTCFAVTNWRK